MQMDRSLILLNDIVIEFAENQYILEIEKSSDDSGYEYAFLRSSWKPFASNLFRWFRSVQNSCNSENGSRNVAAMVAMFQEFQHEMFAALKEYILIEGIFETCYHLQLQDNNLVCQVLDLMYGCWSSFGPLHFKAVLGRRIKRPDKDAPNLLSYFLNHAMRKKLEYNGVRMIDVSVYSCVRKFAVFVAADLWCWKQVLIYLQYGARFEKLFQDPNKSYHGISSPLTETFRMLIRHLWFRLVCPTEGLTNLEDIIKYCANLDPDVRNLCRTFNILLRAVRRISSGSLDYVIRECEGRNSILMIPTREVMTHITVKIMIPKLFDRYECPDELKHSCRWVIRQRLNENWQLPYGIESLPVPHRMQRYLNLKTN